jgi:hypothetical protein
VDERTPEQRPQDLAALEQSWHHTVVPDASKPPVVYGYLRVPRGHPARAARARREIETFSTAHDFSLVTTFSDCGVHHDALRRPGFAGLLDVLRLPGSYGVVIPAWQHLSPDPDELRDLLQQVIRTCCRVFVVRDKKAWAPNTDGANPLVLEDADHDDVLPRIGAAELPEALRLKYQRFFRQLP